MKKLLIIDDDEALLGLYRRRLSGSYELIETDDAENALALALQHKPDAILLDLKMPKFDGFELCRNFRSLTHTSEVPIFVVTGESGRYRKECESIGAAGYFEKPIDFAKLKQSLAATLDGAESRERAVPLRMRVGLRLEGINGQRQSFKEPVTTESVSPDGFQFTSATKLGDGSVVDVFLTGKVERHVGRARIVERFAAGLEVQSYRAVFDGPVDWIVQKSS